MSKHATKQWGRSLPSTSRNAALTAKHCSGLQTARRLTPAPIPHHKGTPVMPGHFCNYITAIKQTCCWHSSAQFIAVMQHMMIRNIHVTRQSAHGHRTPFLQRTHNVPGHACNHYRRDSRSTLPEVRHPLHKPLSPALELLAAMQFMNAESVKNDLQPCPLNPAP